MLAVGLMCHRHRSLSGAAGGQRTTRPAKAFLCELLDCPEQPTHRRAIVHTIEVLKKTKDTFKSKVLANLREELERTMRKSGDA